LCDGDGSRGRARVHEHRFAIQGVHTFDQVLRPGPCVWLLATAAAHQAAAACGASRCRVHLSRMPVSVFFSPSATHLPHVSLHNFNCTTCTTNYRATPVSHA
jgi:hypothetical protein